MAAGVRGGALGGAPSDNGTIALRARSARCRVVAVLERQAAGAEIVAILRAPRNSDSSSEAPLKVLQYDARAEYRTHQYTT